MKFTKLDIPEIILIEPRVFADERGSFYESFNEKLFKDFTDFEGSFVQDNHSESIKGVLRGLHYQLDPISQGKLVRVLRGEVFDVAVDIRKESKTFKQWVGVNLSAENRKQLWIPRGFAHGFITLSDRAEFSYKVTNYYSPSLERSIRWNDQEIHINWPNIIESPIISQKDKNAPLLKECDKLY